MGTCPKCGTKNDDDAAFCKSCGVSLKSDTISATIERRTKKFAKDMEQMGKKAGKTMVKTAKHIQEDTIDIGNRIEESVGHASKHAENWYDRTFGVLGPLLSSFIGLIVLRIVIEGMRVAADDVLVLGDIGAILHSYLVLIFCIILLSSYTTYFSRKYTLCRWISPVSAAIIIIAFSWIIAKILSVIGSQISEVSFLTKTEVMTQQYLPTIFVFILVIGYLILGLTISRDHQEKN